MAPRRVRLALWIALAYGRLLEVLGQLVADALAPVSGDDLRE